MGKRIGGLRRKTRQKLSRKYNERGKIKISRYFKEFNNGDKVAIKIEPSVHKGFPEPVFHGKIGKIIGKRGECYIVRVKDHSVVKKLIVHPIHLVSQK